MFKKGGSYSAPPDRRAGMECQTQRPKHEYLQNAMGFPGVIVVAGSYLTGNVGLTKVTEGRSTSLGQLTIGVKVGIGLDPAVFIQVL